MTDRGAIIERIEAALEKARVRELEIRAVYLSEADWRDYDRARSRRYGSRVSCHSHRGIPIRPGKASVIYSSHGVGIAVPKRLSHRVAA